MQPNVSISQTELATQWPHRTQASSVPHQTLLPVDPFSPGFLLVSRSAFSPLLTSPAALSSSSHTGIVGFQALPVQKRGAILPRIPLPSLGRPRRSAHIAPRAAPWLRDLSLLCVTSSLALNSAGTSMSIPQTLQFTVSF